MLTKAICVILAIVGTANSAKLGYNYEKANDLGLGEASLGEAAAPPTIKPKPALHFGASHGLQSLSAAPALASTANLAGLSAYVAPAAHLGTTSFASAATLGLGSGSLGLAAASHGIPTTAPLAAAAHLPAAAQYGYATEAPIGLGHAAPIGLSHAGSLGYSSAAPLGPTGAGSYGLTGPAAIGLAAPSHLGYTGGASLGLTNAAGLGLSNGLGLGYAGALGGYSSALGGYAGALGGYAGALGGYAPGLGYNGLDAGLGYATGPAAEPPLVNTQFYLHTAPEDHSEITKAKHITIGRPQKNYRVVFIKAPSSGTANAQISVGVAPQEEKTVIYVLSQKQQDLNINGVVQQSPAIANKPEVFFIKYKTPEEAHLAQQQIQAQYESLGGSTQISDEGVAPVSSVVGTLGQGLAHATGPAIAIGPGLAHATGPAIAIGQPAHFAAPYGHSPLGIAPAYGTLAGHGAIATLPTAATYAPASAITSAPTYASAFAPTLGHTSEILASAAPAFGHTAPASLAPASFAAAISDFSHATTKLAHADPTLSTTFSPVSNLPTGPALSSAAISTAPGGLLDGGASLGPALDASSTLPSLLDGSSTLASAFEDSAITSPATTASALSAITSTPTFSTSTIAAAAPTFAATTSPLAHGFASPAKFSHGGLEPISKFAFGNNAYSSTSKLFHSTAAPTTAYSAFGNGAASFAGSLSAKASFIPARRRSH